MPHELFDEAEIGEAFGLAAETLRHYRERNLLQPVRIAAGFYYTAKDRVRLQIIEKGKRLGFSLTEIEAILRAQPAAAAGADISQAAGPETLQIVGDVVAPGDRDTVRARLAQLERQQTDLQANIDRLRSMIDD